jgi:hypothetical protein
MTNESVMLVRRNTDNSFARVRAFVVHADQHDAAIGIGEGRHSLSNVCPRPPTLQLESHRLGNEVRF